MTRHPLSRTRLIGTAIVTAVALGSRAGWAPRPRTKPAVPPSPAAAVTTEAIDDARERLGRVADRLDPADGYPRSTDPDGRWVLREATELDQRFLRRHALVLVYKQTGEPVWRDRAERWTALGWSRKPNARTPTTSAS